MAAGPNIQTSENPAVLAGGQFGSVIQSTDTTGVPAAQVAGDLVVTGTITSSGSDVQINSDSVVVDTTTGADQVGHSFQPVAADLTVTDDAGSDDGSDPKFLAAVMGNVHDDGSELTNEANYVAGVIGAYSVAVPNDSTYPVGAVLAQVSDGVDDSNVNAVVAYVDGDSAVTTCGAMFKVKCNNSNAGSGADYGLDLQDAAHDGYLPVDETFYKVAPIRLVSDVVITVAAFTDNDATTLGDGSLVLDPAGKVGIVTSGHIQTLALA